MSLLLQLNADLFDWFPTHERRLYVLGCKRKACRRKNGSVRALRAIRASEAQDVPKDDNDALKSTAQPAPNLGETLFGAKSPTPAQANPFASPSATSSNSNPFSSSKPADTKPAESQHSASLNGLAETFAQKARISSSTTPPAGPKAPHEAWPDDPTPYPSSHVDADKEYLDSSANIDGVPSNARVDTEAGGSSAAEEKALFESSMDKTFQRFADRLAQNPEQILRYEFAGQPLLYSKSDAVGKLLSPTGETRVQTATSTNGNAAGALKIPRCTACGAARVFELQLTPHAITELEAEEMSIDGMDWGTIVVGVCSEDCQEKGKAIGDVGYVEEWVGVQWEEVADSRKR